MRTRTTYLSEKARDESYAEIAESLSGMRKIIYECIANNFPISDNGIAEKTGIRVHIVAARRNELWGKEKDPVTNRYEINKDLQVIEFAGYDETSTPKQSLWKPVLKTLQPSLF